MNQEHPKYPGFYFVPLEQDPDLVELTLHERRVMLSEEGNYAVMLADMSNPSYKIDVQCACDNARIPTHRHKENLVHMTDGFKDYLQHRVAAVLMH